MARASKQQAARTGETILRVATRAFAERGFTGVALEQVAAEAGVTRGAVYHRYASKQELFAAVLALVMRQVGDRVVSAAEASADAFTQLELGGAEFVRAALSPDIRRIMLVDGPAVVGWAGWREMDARYSRHALEQGLTALREQQGLAGLEPEVVAVLLSGALNEAALWVADADDQRQALAEVEVGYRTLLRALSHGPSDPDRHGSVA